MLSTDYYTENEAIQNIENSTKKKDTFYQKKLRLLKNSLKTEIICLNF
jgi:hypothetical protein